MVQPSSVNRDEVSKLSKALETLDSNITHIEAMKLSQEIYQEVEVLSNEFKLTSPPQYHNFLVNIGIKEKGLCYHWSDALYLHFLKSTYPSFEFHLVGANIGEYWSEHNSMLVVAKGKAIESGIILDAWRNSGKLYFSKLKDDNVYEWKHRADRGCQSKR